MLFQSWKSAAVPIVSRGERVSCARGPARAACRLAHEIFTAAPTRKKRLPKPWFARCGELPGARTWQGQCGLTHCHVPKRHVTPESGIVAQGSHPRAKHLGNKNAYLYGLLIPMPGSKCVTAEDLGPERYRFQLRNDTKLQERLWLSLKLCLEKHQSSHRCICLPRDSAVPRHHSHPWHTWWALFFPFDLFFSATKVNHWNF